MDKKQYKNVYVFAETRDGKIQDVAYQLLGKGREIADKTHSTLHAMLLGSGVKIEAKKLIAAGADEVIVADDKNLKDYVTEQYAQALYQIINERKPNIILVGATSIGRDLAPRLSAKLGTGLTADCTKLEVEEDGSLYMTRPAFGGNLMATIISPDHRPQMSTVRPGVMQKLPADNKRSGIITDEKIKFNEKNFKVELVKVLKATSKIAKIEDAKILVSIGRGVKKDVIPLAEEFAKVIGGTLSCSRAVVDDGTLPQDRQVGQTGKTVRPQVYFALGISGAIQHVAGMEESELIIAINKDKFANIFKVADLGIVGDVKKVLPLLIEEVKKAKKA